MVRVPPSASPSVRILPVHPPRPPSTAPGTQAFTWALVFGTYTWAFMLAVDSSLAMSSIVGALVGGGSFLLVRLYGADLARGRQRRARRTKA